MDADERKMKWLVENRIEIQKTALDLYSLIANEQRPVNKQTSLIHQDLVGAYFCLWRGVFLAQDKHSKLGVPHNNALDFLRKVIDDNSITFGDDKTFREWTANFYVDCAGRILLGFPPSRTGRDTRRCETVSPAWVVEDYPSDIRERWKYNHTILKRKIQSMTNR
jgi:hypothetical protein